MNHQQLVEHLKSLGFGFHTDIYGVYTNLEDSTSSSIIYDPDMECYTFRYARNESELLFVTYVKWIKTPEKCKELIQKYVKFEGN